MTQKRRIEISTTAYFALCVGLCTLVIYTDANIINEESGEAGNDNRKDWYAVLLKSKSQFGFERGSRSLGKPTFIRFGKRDFDAYASNIFNIK